MDTDSSWRSYIKEADIYYKLSEEMKLTHPLIAYFSNLHGLRKVSKNLNKNLAKKTKSKIMAYLKK